MHQNSIETHYWCTINNKYCILRTFETALRFWKNISTKQYVHMYIHVHTCIYMYTHVHTLLLDKTQMARQATNKNQTDDFSETNHTQRFAILWDLIKWGAQIIFKWHHRDDNYQCSRWRSLMTAHVYSHCNNQLPHWLWIFKWHINTHCWCGHQTTRTRITSKRAKNEKNTVQKCDTSGSNKQW